MSSDDKTTHPRKLRSQIYSKLRSNASSSNGPSLRIERLDDTDDNTRSTQKTYTQLLSIGCDKQINNDYLINSMFNTETTSDTQKQTNILYVLCLIKANRNTSTHPFYLPCNVIGWIRFMLGYIVLHSYHRSFYPPFYILSYDSLSTSYSQIRRSEIKNQSEGFTNRLSKYSDNKQTKVNPNPEP
jgi:hypothetical protein